jgi:hypothetical protein
MVHNNTDPRIKMLTKDRFLTKTAMPISQFAYGRRKSPICWRQSAKTCTAFHTEFDASGEAKSREGVACA